MRGATFTGIAAIALAVCFNIPYALLASVFEYPAILRTPASHTLTRFAEGGPMLVLIWYGFVLAALALIPVSIALSVTPLRMAQQPALAIGAAFTGALAGTLQAVGLARWVFVVPQLANAKGTGGTGAAGQLASEHSFALLNAYGGVAIGEHLGQMLTAAFVVQLALLQRQEGHRSLAATGMVTALLLLLGTGEGLALALGQSSEHFSHATIAGFLGLTVWMILTGLAHMRSIPKF